MNSENLKPAIRLILLAALSPILALATPLFLFITWLFLNNRSWKKDFWEESPWKRMYLDWRILWNWKMNKELNPKALKRARQRVVAWTGDEHDALLADEILDTYFRAIRHKSISDAE